jgi:hypothetical protein
MPYLDSPEVRKEAPSIHLAPDWSETINKEAQKGAFVHFAFLFLIHSTISRLH